MIGKDALVIYKNKPALVKDVAEGKISISLEDGSSVKVREKDIEIIHAGPVKDFSGIKHCQDSSSAVREAWELLSGEKGETYSLKDLASLVFGDSDPSSVYNTYRLLHDGLYFSGAINAILPRSREEVTADEAKRGEKQRDLNERAQFLDRLKAVVKKPAENQLLSDDARFMQDVEALAYGKSEKSKTMKDLGLSETPQDAHLLLLNTKLWTSAVNPHPARFGISQNTAECGIDPPPEEERRDLTHLISFAIDSPWSNDPDDAVSIETDPAGNSILFVHIADPTASIKPDSPAEKEARDRGATLYLPEGAVRMLADEALSLFALGFSEKSKALTFKMTIDESGEITETDIFPSVVKTRRLTYEQADSEMNGSSDDSKALRALSDLSQKIHKRRSANEAVNIELPESHISIENGVVKIEPIIPYRSASMVRECMIATGEGAGTWAAGNGLVFPYITQEVEMQGPVPKGMAGSYQLRRCMRPRILSTKPGRHWGLGLDNYTQVTSPLRRYTDLLAHLQIRAFLRGEEPLSTDLLLTHLGAGEASATAVTHAERASRAHWTAVYLSDKKDSVWQAVALEKKGNRWAVIIPSLALEMQVPLQNDVAPNDTVSLVLKSANIPKGEAVFINVPKK